MKNFTLIFLIIQLSNSLYAQTDCDNNVSTDFNNPTNQALPVNLSSKYLNGTDWFPVGNIPDSNQGLYLDLPLTNMSFSGVTLDEMVSIRSGSLLADYDYLKTGPLPIGINGWELLLVNLGRFPDNVTELVDGNDFSALPYIILYNRYSGILRVFANFGLDATVGNGADAVVISISFNNSDQVSGLMRLYSGFDQALDQTTDVLRMTSVVKASNNKKQWFSTDFQITYDPCTCYYPSELVVNFRQIKNQSIELHGRAITLPNESLVDNSNLIVNPTSYLSGFDYSGQDVNGGVLIYKSMQAMIDDYIAKYEQYNKDLVANANHNAYVKKNLAMLKVAKAIIAILIFNANSGGGGGGEIGGGAIASIAQAESANMSATQLTAAFQGTGENNWFDVAKKFSEGAIKKNDSIDVNKIFKIIKLVFGDQGKTFVANNFETQNLPTPPSAPTATFTEMHFSGQITETLDKSGPTFYTPGTYGSQGTGSPTVTAPYKYPIYNDVLGTFALLKSPKVRISKQVINEDWKNELFQETTNYTSGLHGLKIMRYLQWSQEYQLKLAEDLKYAVNSNIDVTDVKIQSAFYVKAFRKDLEISNHIQMNCFIDSTKSINQISSGIDLSRSSPILSRKPFEYYLEHPDFDPYHFGYGEAFTYYDPNEDNFDIEQPSVKLDTFDFHTRYYPLDAFYPAVSSIGIKNEAMNISETLIPDYDIPTYDTSFVYGPPGSYSGIFFNNLNDSRIVKPQLTTPFVNGYDLNFDLELKLIVDISFATINEFGNPNTSTQILTYKISPDDIIYENDNIVNNLESTSINLNGIPENIYLSEQNLTMYSEIPGCNFSLEVWPTLKCKAINNIYVDGKLTADTPYGLRVELVAGNEVIVGNDSELSLEGTLGDPSPEFYLFIEPSLDYSHPMPQVNQTYVTNFCGTTNNPSNYKASASTKGLILNDIFSENGNSEITKGLNSYFDFSIYPNPSNGSFTLIVSDKSENVQISLVDMLGREVAFKQSLIGNNQYAITLSDAGIGIYTIQVIGTNGKGAKRIMVK